MTTRFVFSCCCCALLLGIRSAFGSAVHRQPHQGGRPHSSDPTRTIKSAKSLTAELQKCHSPTDVLHRVGRHVGGDGPSDSDSDSNLFTSASLASLILVRLSKQCIALDNAHENNASQWVPHYWSNEDESNILGTVLDAAMTAPPSCTISTSNMDSVVEATKAFAVLSRLIPTLEESHRLKLVAFWQDACTKEEDSITSVLEPHHHSGLYWAFQTLAQTTTRTNVTYPSALQRAYEKLELPFTVIPKCLDAIPDLSMATISGTTQFAVDEIVTTSHRRVLERRQTAWQGDTHVGPFLYSGKSMSRQDWSPVVRSVRDSLHQHQGTCRYDCCLLNLYPDGGSGMRYHSDPDQGTLWDHDTAVVSVGATRRFAFRRLDSDGPPHTFWVLHGDVTRMIGDCQQDFQHTVKKADNRKDTAARISLVFKRTWRRDD